MTARSRGKLSSAALSAAVAMKPTCVLGPASLPVPRAEGGVEGGRRGLDRGQRADPGQRVGRADQAVHSGVLPLDRQRPGVADGVEDPDTALEVDVPVAQRDEVPAAARVAPGQVRTQAAVAAVEALLGVLEVDVVDPVPEVPGEAEVVEVLPDEVAGVEVE